MEFMLISIAGYLWFEVEKYERRCRASGVEPRVIQLRITKRKCRNLRQPNYPQKCTLVLICPEASDTQKITKSKMGMDWGMDF